MIDSVALFFYLENRIAECGLEHSATHHQFPILAGIYCPTEEPSLRAEWLAAELQGKCATSRPRAILVSVPRVQTGEQAKFYHNVIFDPK